MNTSLTRRNFAHLLGGAAALAALPPLAARAKPSAAAAAAGEIRLSANENPYGPSPAALAALEKASSLAWRYPDEAIEALVADLAKLHGVSADSILLGNGSSEILHLAADTIKPGTKLVVADPTFEALAMHAAHHNIDVVKVPLDASFAHDLTAMSQVPNAGLMYICNPNNPTGSITPRARVKALLDSWPGLVLVDEAYHHYATSPDYESVIPLTKSRPNLLVARTFSKIFGMAGLRCGYCVGNPEAIKTLADEQQWDSFNIMALAAARASIGDEVHVATGRKRNAETRSSLLAALGKLGLRAIPSEANFVMIDMKRNVKPLIAAMRERGVQVGRFFPALPQHMRVTIGTAPQMERFAETLQAVI